MRLSLDFYHPYERQFVAIEEFENGEATYFKDLKTRQATFVPAGTIHYQQKFGEKTARNLAVLNSDNPGVLWVLPNLFTLPLEILSAGQHLKTDTLARLRKIQPLRAVPDAFPADTLQFCAEVVVFPLLFLHLVTMTKEITFALDKIFRFGPSRTKFHETHPTRNGHPYLILAS